jgi:hypothetical protein
MPQLHVDIDPTTSSRRIASFIRVTSADRSVLCRDDCRPLVARRNHRSRSPRDPGRALRSPINNYRSPLENGRYGSAARHGYPARIDNIAQPRSLAARPQKRRTLVDAMSDASIAFARSGNPNHKWDCGMETLRAHDAPDDGVR